jgi:hypothetical protein
MQSLTTSYVISCACVLFCASSASSTLVLNQMMKSRLTFFHHKTKSDLLFLRFQQATQKRHHKMASNNNGASTVIDMEKEKIDFTAFVIEWKQKSTDAKKTVDELEYKLQKAIKSPPSNLRAEFETLDAIHKLDMMIFSDDRGSNRAHIDDETNSKCGDHDDGACGGAGAVNPVVVGNYSGGSGGGELEYNKRFHEIYKLDTKLASYICDQDLSMATQCFVSLVSLVVGIFKDNAMHDESDKEGVDDETVEDESSFNTTKLDHLTYQSREALIEHLKPLKYLIETKIASYLIEIGWPKCDGTTFKFRSRSKEQDDFKEYCLMLLRLQTSFIQLNSFGHGSVPDHVWLIDVLLSPVNSHVVYCFCQLWFFFLFFCKL